MPSFRALMWLSPACYLGPQLSHKPSLNPAMRISALPLPWVGHTCIISMAQFTQMQHPWTRSPLFLKVTLASSPIAELRRAEEFNRIRLMRSWLGGLPVS